MTRGERIAMWGLVAGLAVCAYMSSLRTDTLDHRIQRLALTATSSTTSLYTATTTTPLEAAVEELRRQVLELRATRGLSGPEVRRLVETLLPAPGCVEPPCDASGAAASSGTTTTVGR